MTIALVEDIGGALFDRRLLADRRVVDVGVCDRQNADGAAVAIRKDMHLHAADAAVRLSPIVELAERNGRGVDQADEFGAFSAAFAVEETGKLREEIGEDNDGAALIGVGEGRALQGAATEMIVMARA